MILACMLATDKEALICDLAETYGIFDMKALPVSLLATLSAGLRDDSRIKMKVAGARTTSEIMLLAGAVDRLSVLVWAQTEDGRKGRNKPQLIAPLISGSVNRNGVTAFDSADDFKAAWARNLKGDNNGN